MGNLSVYVALLRKVDMSDDRAGSQQMSEAVLVALHGFVVLSIVVETTCAR